MDGIYYAALGGESYLFNDEEFERYIKPCDLRILEAAKKVPAFNILHVCKDRLNLGRYTDYPCEVVNWGVYEQNPSLEEGKKLFPGKVLLGGLDDRAGVLVDGRRRPSNRRSTRFSTGWGPPDFCWAPTAPCPPRSPTRTSAPPSRRPGSTLPARKVNNGRGPFIRNRRISI